MPPMRETLLQTRTDIDRITEEWMCVTYQCLKIISRRKNCANVLVSSCSLINTFAKLFLHQLTQFFSIRNVYSATKIGKESCMERIIARFGKSTSYVSIGDGRDEESASKQHNIPFWPIASHNDLLALHD